MASAPASPINSTFETNLVSGTLATAVATCFTSLWFAGASTEASKARAPTQRFKLFIQETLQITQVSTSVVVLALYYVRKLKQKNVSIAASRGSEYRLAIAALMLSNKVLDDNTYTARTWADVSALDLNPLVLSEKEFLQGLDWELAVSPEEFSAFEKLLSFSSSSSDLSGGSTVSGLGKRLRTSSVPATRVVGTTSPVRDTLPRPKRSKRSGSVSRSAISNSACVTVPSSNALPLVSPPSQMTAVSLRQPSPDLQNAAPLATSGSVRSSRSNAKRYRATSPLVDYPYPPHYLAPYPSSSHPSPLYSPPDAPTTFAPFHYSLPFENLVDAFASPSYITPSYTSDALLFNALASTFPSSSWTRNPQRQSATVPAPVYYHAHLHESATMHYSPAGSYLGQSATGGNSFTPSFSDYSNAGLPAVHFDRSLSYPIYEQLVPVLSSSKPLANEFSYYVSN